jgi:hypothetical protein
LEKSTVVVFSTLAGGVAVLASATGASQGQALGPPLHEQSWSSSFCEALWGKLIVVPDPD